MVTVFQWSQEYFDSNPEDKADRDRADLRPNLPAQLNTPHHISSQTEPYFRGPVAISLDRDGCLVVVDSNRHRFQVDR